VHFLNTYLRDNSMRQRQCTDLVKTYSERNH